MKKRLLLLAIALGIMGFGVQQKEVVSDQVVAGFSSARGFVSLQSNAFTDANYTFGVIDIPLERPGAASSSLSPEGYEFGKLQFTGTTAVTVASGSAGFAVTMQHSGKIKGCAFELNAAPTTGTVSIMIQQNGTLLTGKYCKLPVSGTFVENGGNDDISRTDTFFQDSITFVAGDRIGLIASSSNLNAATIDGIGKLIIQLNN